MPNVGEPRGMLQFMAVLSSLENLRCIVTDKPLLGKEHLRALVKNG
ncbi:MAG: hypothetical protein ACRC7P_03320 [Enterovibrio sp.]